MISTKQKLIVAAKKQNDAKSHDVVRLSPSLGRHGEVISEVISEMDTADIARLQYQRRSRTAQILNAKPGRSAAD